MDVSSGFKFTFVAVFYKVEQDAIEAWRAIRGQP